MCRINVHGVWSVERVGKYRGLLFVSRLPVRIGERHVARLCQGGTCHWQQAEPTDQDFPAV